MTTATRRPGEPAIAVRDGPCDGAACSGGRSCFPSGARSGEEVVRSVDPWSLLAGVSAVTTTAAEAGVAQGQDLRDLYAASYAWLVGTVGAVCGDRHEAEEAV